ncbi:MAG: NADPH-dependent reductase flavoprotein [Phenylobacterium sp.]|nr:NADPH-dependent reductase flavoprotein [Phenylobacterium sp.]
MGDTYRPLIIGIGGTARDGSNTERALKAALAVAEGIGARTTLFGGEFLARLPHYNPEADVRTAEEQAMIAAVRAADGLIFASPAYHGGISGVVKNAIDLLEETAQDDRVYLDERPVGLIVSAIGPQAAGATLGAMRAVVHALRGWPTPLGVAINSANAVFDPDGTTIDPALAGNLALLGRQVMQFVQWRSSVERPTGSSLTVSAAT